MWPFKYHFYEVTDTEDTTYILISRREIMDAGKILDVRKVSTYMFFELEDQEGCNGANGSFSE